MAAGIKVGGGRFGGPQNVTVFDQDVDGLGDGPFTPTVVQMDPATGLPISPRPQGAQPTTSSQSVSPATDSPPFPTKVQDGSAPGGTVGYTLAAVGTFFTVDMTGYSSISVQTVAAAASSFIRGESSLDGGTTWSIEANTVSDNIGGAQDGTNVQVVVGRMYKFQPSGKLFRVVQYAYGGAGNTTIVPVLRSAGLAPRSVFIGGGVTLGVSGSVGINNVNCSAGPGGLASTSRIPSAAATTNATVAKASAGRVYKVVGFNTSASVKHIKFYNKASAPTVGTDVPIFSRPLPPGGFGFDWMDMGYYFSAGISYAITGGPLDADNTALAAADIVSLNVDYV